MKFQLIIADPPYVFADKLEMSDVARGALANYVTMTTSKIKEMPVKDISDQAGSVLALWVPSSIIQDGLDIMKAWGFTQKQIWVWTKTKKKPLKELSKALIKNLKENKNDSQALIVKNTIDDFTKGDWSDKLMAFGMGRISRNIHEIALIGTCGKINKRIKNRSQRAVFLDAATEHSVKSEILQDRLDKIFPDPTINRIEIFGRRLRDNYLVIGNESPTTLNEDIFESMKNLIENA